MPIKEGGYIPAVAFKAVKAGGGEETSFLSFHPIQYQSKRDVYLPFVSIQEHAYLPCFHI